MEIAEQDMSRKPHRVLLLENDHDARRTILSTLKKSGYGVVEASSSDHAVILLGAPQRPAAVSAILCDIRADRIKGIEATAYFRARHPQIPVIVTAAYPDIEWAITLMKRGATDYLVKPVSRDDLLMILRSAVRRHETVQRGSF
jgi:two-component system response regulator AtoC